MTAPLLSRRTLACGLAAISTGFSAVARAHSQAPATQPHSSSDLKGLTHEAEAIHQEIVFKAPPQLVFEALMDAVQFDAITRLSDAIALVSAANAKPTSISREVGGSFTLFGGYVTGRNLEIIPGQRLVQAWRAGSWEPGEYSIAEFLLDADSSGTKLTLQHGGFPQGQGTYLAPGWYSHYWEPLGKYLLQHSP